MPSSRDRAFEPQRFAAVAKFVSSGTTTRRDSRGKYPLYGSTGQIDRTNRREFTGPSILVARVGANAGSIYVVDGSYGVTDNTLVVRLAPGHNRSFFAQYLELAELNRMVYGSGQPLVTGSMLKNLDVPVVDSAEQARVAAALDDVNEFIATLERLVAKKQAIKEGMMQQLLTGRTRLLSFTDDWELGQIADLARVSGGGTPSTSVASYWNGNVPWFTPAEIKRGGSGLVSRSERTISEEGLAHSAAALLPAGTVLVTSRASIGNCAVAAVPVTTNQGFASMIPKDLRSTWFLYYWTQHNRGALESRSAGSTFLEISASEVAAIPISSPPLEEQAAIGSTLRDADVELDKLNERLAKARSIKQGMMQQLLTGRVRLPVEDAA